MALTPETLVKHELVGLHVRVVESTDPGRVGIEGRVVGETMRTLEIRRESGVVQVPKAGTTFEFALTDEAAGAREGTGGPPKPSDTVAGSDGDDVTYVTVDGARLLSRPAYRTENGVTTLWQ
ncbi:ribonuclease P protein component 1 [Halanaeroarchaeum sulfurireducens]|uniref:Ribonuclease P protein component 1 n=1 Tax=Halanaeroarchaeum sulfurireducens TaxID=1604004 RepID=A0A0F7PG44_9EURY|nr:ribonuclease P protein component 1 [Halanaeroarchaeum sulfurireducens]ALG82652.1 ribonuclease P protein component 1 [Halanaeroarchaeum sulfurireducens]